MKKYITYSFMVLIAVILVCTFAISGCGTAKTTGTKEISIMMMPKTIDNPVFATAGKGCEKAASELGFNLVWTGPTADDPATQNVFMETQIVKKVDGIGVSVSDAAALTPVINKAIKAGIKVICWDSDAADSDRILYYGTNNYDGGVAMAKLLIEKMGNTGKIAIWNVQVGAPNLEERYKGVQDTLAKEAPEIEIVQVVTGGGMEVAKSVQAFEDYTKSHPEINGWIAVDGFPFFGTTDTMPTVAERAKAGDLAIVTFDSIESELAYVDEGIVYGLAGQRYYDWGYEGSKILYNLITNPSAKYNDIEFSGLDIITKAGGAGRISVAEMRENWKKWQ
jgi:ribose transport system substrate-binding protein